MDENFFQQPVNHPSQTMRFPALRQSLLEVLVSTTLLLVLIAAYYAYLQGLAGNFFVFDDRPSLSPLNNFGGVTSLHHALAFIFSGDTGPTGRPLALASFLLDDQYWPGDPTEYRKTSLLFHLLTGVVLFILLRQLTRLTNLPRVQREILALGVTALFLLHPLNSTTVLYIVQRMTILSALFLLSGLSGYLAIRLRQWKREYQTQQQLILWLIVTLFALLATFSKENGILIVLFIAVIEFCFTDSLTPLYAKLRSIITNKSFTPFLAFALFVIAAWMLQERIHVGYQNRSFTLVERLLTESTILFDYVQKILFPRIFGLSLYHDDVTVRTGLDFVVTLSLTAIVLLLLFALRCRKQTPVLSFAILWFFSGHLIESTILPLELYYEHRNYVPMIGPIFALFYYPIKATTLPGLSLAVRNAFYLIPVCFLLASIALTYQTARTWSNDSFLFSKWAMEHPESLRANLTFANYLKVNGANRRALEYYQDIAIAFPDKIIAKLYLLDSRCHNNLPIDDLFKDITGQLRNGDYSIRIEAINIVRSLVDSTLQGKCKTLSRDNLLSLVKQLQAAPFAHSSKRFASHIYFMEADIHIARHDLNGAVIALDHAFESQPTVDIPLKQAVLLASAGLYQEALSKLSIAYAADSDRPRLSPSRSSEIELLERVIDNEINAATK